MSWLISMIVSGAIIASGSNFPDWQNENNTIPWSGGAAPVVVDESERFEKTYPFDSNGKIEVSNLNGSIQIDSWDRNEIRFEYVKIADKKERLADLDVKIEAQPSTFTVSTKHKKTKHKTKSKRDKWGKNWRKLTVDFKLMVPKTARLDSIESVNGSVTVSNMTSYSDISVVNGSVKATNLRGIVDLSTVHGAVYADFNKLDAGSAISLETVNGKVKLIIPSDSNATLKAKSTMGGITNDFRLPVQKGKYLGRSLHGKIGSGNAKISLRSVNGGLSIMRKKDGKSLSPSINLLKLDADSDDDDEFEINVSAASDVKRAKLRAKARKARGKARENAREARKAIRAKVMTNAEIEVISKEALKETRKALEKIEFKELRIDSEKLKKSLLEAEKAQREALKNISGAVFSRSSPFIEEKTETFEVKGIPNIEIDAADCSVIVRGWDKKEVKYSLSRVKRNPRAAPVMMQTENGNTLKIKVKTVISGGRYKDGGDVRLEVFVPKKSNLEIHTHRELRVEGISGDIKLKSENGAVNVRDVSGKLNLNATNKYKNRVRIVGFEGEFSANAVNSDVYLEGEFEKIIAEGKGSSFYLTLADDADAMIETNSFGVKRWVKPGSTITVGGIEVTKQATGMWRVGDGEAKYIFDLYNGSTYVRSLDSIRGR